MLGAVLGGGGGGSLSSSRGEDSFAFAFAQKTVEHNYETVARQLLEDECMPYPREQFVEPLTDLVAGGLVAMEKLHLHGAGEAYAQWMETLLQIMQHPWAAFECPLALTAHIRKMADAVLSVGQKNRARTLLQVGNMFKLQAMSKWWTLISTDYNAKDKLPPKRLQRYLV